MKKPISVFIVDDSKTAREFLIHIINSDPELNVTGFAENAEETLLWLRHHSPPDVITMDILMPKMNGFELTQKILEMYPIPIVIVSAIISQSDAEQCIKAINAGALATLKKPLNLKDKGYERDVKELIETIKISATVKVKTKPKSITKNEDFPLNNKKEEVKKNYSAIAIGSSVGGPSAISTILTALPASLPVPIFLVQHIAPGFMQGLVNWLQESSNIPISVAQNEELALPGHCYIAPNDCQMEIKKGNIISLNNSSEKISIPSVSHLFKSMAETYGGKGIGVILSGMGKDGAKELLEMREKGAYTIAQNEETCVVFGMPKEAIALGAAQIILPIEKIAGQLAYLTHLA